MAEQPLPPAINGTDMRLDALIRRVDRLCDLLTPAKGAAVKDGATIEIRGAGDPKAVADEVAGQLTAAIKRRTATERPKKKQT